MDLAIKEVQFIKILPECLLFMEMPFIIYFKNGDIVRATSGIQTEDEISAVGDQESGGITEITKSTFYIACYHAVR